MRHVYLLANLDRHDDAERLARAVRRHLDGREDMGVQPRIFVRGGRVNLEGVPSALARELKDWCADELRRGGA